MTEIRYRHEIRKDDQGDNVDVPPPRSRRLLLSRRDPRRKMNTQSGPCTKGNERIDQRHNRAAYTRIPMRSVPVVGQHPMDAKRRDGASAKADSQEPGKQHLMVSVHCDHSIGVFSMSLESIRVTRRSLAFLGSLRQASCASIPMTLIGVRHSDRRYFH